MSGHVLLLSFFLQMRHDIISASRMLNGVAGGLPVSKDLSATAYKSLQTLPAFPSPLLSKPPDLRRERRLWSVYPSRLVMGVALAAARGADPAQTRQRRRDKSCFLNSVALKM
jgi:hypothetical protein